MKFALAMLLAAVSAVRINQKSTRPTPAEIFAAIDTDNSGAITRAELAAWVTENASQYGLPTDEKYWDQEFAKADTDGDDQVTQQELANHLGGGNQQQQQYNAVDGVMQ